MNIRVGEGWDVHALVEGRKLMLGGVEIPYEKGLLGHSDADALLHAITDALLGAAGLGDIGRHFPDTDPRFQGADSSVLLAEAATRVRAQGWQIGNVDSTIVAQAPKSLTVRMSYGGSFRVNTEKNTIIDEKIMTREEWRAQKETELNELEKTAAAALPREKVNGLFLLALFCKTNQFAGKGTAALERAIEDDAFEWLLDTYFVADKPELAALWRTATKRQAPPAAKPPEVARAPEETKRPPAGELTGPDPDAPLPASAEELGRVARALYAGGRQALGKALPGMERAGTWRKEALRRFQRAREALAKLSTTTPLDPELASLDADIAVMISTCIKDLGFFD